MLDGRVRRLLDRPEKWTKGVGARDAGGMQVPARGSDTKLCSYCLVGAVIAAYDDVMDSNRAMLTMAKSVNSERPRKEPTFVLIDFNDSPETTHEDIVKLLDETGA